MERVVVLEFFCTVFGAGSCSGSVVHSTWRGLVFWQVCVQFLDRAFVPEFLCTVLGEVSCSGSVVQSTWRG